MNIVLLFRGGGNWLPFLFIMVGAFLLIKAVEWLVRRLIAKLHHRKHVHHTIDHPFE